MTYENYIKGKLMDVGVLEGLRHGSYQNALAVCQVMANRVRAGWEGGDWWRVLSTSRNFIGTVYETTPPIVPREISFRTLLQRVDDIYHGTAPDLMTNGALFYAELDNINRPWFQQQILADLASHPRIANVGPVTFFG